MYHKKCPKCDQYSHSENRKGMWRCPVCGADITGVKPEQVKPKEETDDKN